MKLACKICHTPIPPEATNLAEGICFCVRCDEWFRIADFLAESDPIARAEKPAGSKVGFVADNDSLGLIIPAGRNKGLGVFFLIFSLFWNTGGWIAIVSTIRRGELGIFNGLFLIPFTLAGFGTLLVAFYAFWGEFSLLIDRKTCRANWSLFKRNYRKNYPTEEIAEVREEMVYTQNHKPVYGVGIICGKKTLKFGSGLSEDERKWIVGEIRHFLKLNG